MKDLILLLTIIISLSGLHACPMDTKQDKESTDKKPTASDNWSVTFERIGGIAGFRDKLIINSTGKSEYYVGKERKIGFELTDETKERLKWVVGRDDLSKAVGEHKGTGKIMDDISYVLQITKGDQVWHFKWASQASHPAILDEIRPVFDEILSDAINLLKSE